MRPPLPYVGRGRKPSRIRTVGKTTVGKEKRLVRKYCFTGIVVEIGLKGILVETGLKEILIETGLKQILVETGIKQIVVETGLKQIVAETD